MPTLDTMAPRSSSKERRAEEPSRTDRVLPGCAGADSGMDPDRLRGLADYPPCTKAVEHPVHITQTCIGRDELRNLLHGRLGARQSKCLYDLPREAIEMLQAEHQALE